MSLDKYSYGNAIGEINSKKFSELCIPNGKEIDYLAELYLEQITFGKWVGIQNREHPNRDMKSSKSQNNW